MTPTLLMCLVAVSAVLAATEAAFLVHPVVVVDPATNQSSVMCNFRFGGDHKDYSVKEGEMLYIPLNDQHIRAERRQFDGIPRCMICGPCRSNGMICAATPETCPDVGGK
jgi:hypothetical protein